MSECVETAGVIVDEKDHRHINRAVFLHASAQSAVTDITTYLSAESGRKQRSQSYGNDKASRENVKDAPDATMLLISFRFLVEGMRMQKADALFCCFDVDRARSSSEFKTDYPSGSALLGELFELPYILRCPIFTVVACEPRHESSCLSHP